MNLEWAEVNEPTSGLLSLFGLTEWWNTTFTETKKEYIESVYKPFGSDPSVKLLTGITACHWDKDNRDASLPAVDGLK